VESKRKVHHHLKQSFPTSTHIVTCACCHRHTSFLVTWRGESKLPLGQLLMFGEALLVMLRVADLCITAHSKESCLHASCQTHHVTW